ncbi:MAG TPA: glycosyl hydrolase family 28 protein [Opitutaceae bacterium]
MKPSLRPGRLGLPAAFFSLLAAVLLSASVASAQPARFVITDYGAVNDAKTLNTAAIQRAIDAAEAAGGGVVVIPAGGKFLSASIFLKQNVELHVAEGAMLLGSNQITDYPKRETRIEGHFEPWTMALINAQGLTGVRISGKGTIDGNGILFWAAFWQRRKENPACTNLEVERPRLMFIDRCTDVRIQDVSLVDSGFWNLHLYRCRNVLVEGVSISAPTTGRILGPSTDGIDIDSSQDVVIRRCKISVNDDNIALKGSKGPFADKDTDSPPVENILVEDCEFGDGNGVITCGSEATIVRNVRVRNVVVNGRTNLLTLKLRPDTPQNYSDIVIDGVTVNGTGRILRVEPWLQFFDTKGQPPSPSHVKDVTIRNVKGNYRTMGALRPNEIDTISNITLENIDLTLTEETFVLGPVDGFHLKNVTVNGKPYVLPAAIAAAPLPRPAAR